MIKVDKIVPGGEGLGTNSDGKKFFFWNALPGEYVEEYEITKNKSHYSKAIATRISNFSPYRAEAKDNCYLSTSPWQIIDYEYELLLKSELVVEMFREHQINIKKPQVITDYHDYYYRNKMEYALYWDNNLNKISLAFHARGSHRKIPIAKSSIERPEIFAAAIKIIEELNAKNEEARKYQSLLLRCNQKGEVSGGLYENHQPHPKFDNLKDEILGHNYSYSPNGFFQINLPVYEMALSEIKKQITTDYILDLYSGVGTIGLSVAPTRHLTLVEVDKFAFGELVNNITLLGKDTTTEDRTRLTRSGMSEALPVTTGRCERVRSGSIFTNNNIVAINAKSEDVTNYITPGQTVILDPPRAGCDRKLIDKLLEVKPEKIIYLSCNPATQARDVKLLLEKYQIEAVKTFNFFPRTPHIENLVVLSCKK